MDVLHIRALACRAALAAHVVVLAKATGVHEFAIVAAPVAVEAMPVFLVHGLLLTCN